MKELTERQHEVIEEARRLMQGKVNLAKVSLETPWDSSDALRRSLTMHPGVEVVITSDTLFSLFRSGDVARLISQCSDGGWWAMVRGREHFIGWEHRGDFRLATPATT